jgi:carboxypeptidase C (cathepsin A)
VRRVCVWVVAITATAWTEASPLAQEAREAQEARAPLEAGELRLLPEASTTRHSLRLGGRRIAYAASAGPLPLRDRQGEIIAQIFHVAYTLDPPDEDRPITFVFNGGPGAASAFLHLGGLGPRVVAFSRAGGYLPPPGRLIDNSSTWLAFTDLFFVDPVGSGYSRAALSREKTEERFFGVRADAEAMAAFIRLYLTRSDRLLSPVFLVGESYGGFRAAVLLETLQEDAGVAPSGAVLLSPVLDFALIRGQDHALLPPALLLPSLAATHLERQDAVGQGEMASRLREVERFALGDYLQGLAMGWEKLPPAVEDALADLTGLAPRIVRRSAGRISASRFAKEYERASGRILSLYDAAIDGPVPDPASPGQSPDPILDPAVPVWTSAFVSYVREHLGYETDLAYRLLHREASRAWDYDTGSNQGYANAIEPLQAARAVNPALQILIAHGYTDLVTPYFASRYLLGQLPPLEGAAPITERVYPGGHMMYMRAASRRALAEDARLLYGRALRAAGESHAAPERTLPAQ